MAILCFSMAIGRALFVSGIQSGTMWQEVVGVCVISWGGMIYKGWDDEQ